MGCIYSAMTPDNRMYIGQTTNFSGRIYHHLSDSRKKKKLNAFHKEIVKFGEDNIRWGIIVDGINNQQVLDNYESFYIVTKDTFNNGLNSTKYSRYRPPCSQETRDKISKTMSGRKLTNEHKEKIGIALKGRPLSLGRIHSDETRQRMKSSAKKGKENHKSKKCLISGIEFETCREASLHFNVSPTTIWRWIDKCKNKARYI